MEGTYNYTVTTLCMTYNHVSFIQDTLHGFLLQRTNFPTVYCIVDDASTDGTTDFLKKWALYNLCTNGENDIWQEKEYGKYAIGALKNKPLSLFVILFLNENHFKKGWGIRKIEYFSNWLKKSKYCAFCEGDDYWIDPDKLTKQVSLLENNSNIMLVYSSFRTVDENGDYIFRSMYEDFKKKSRSGEILHLLLSGNYIMTLTVCMRSFLLEKRLFLDCPTIMDWSYFCVAAMYGDAYYCSEEFGCYRKVETSFTNSAPDIVGKKGNLIKKYYSEQYLKKRYKTVTLRQHRKILYSIANTCIVDRNWSILRETIRNPYFLFVFIVEFMKHLVKKLRSRPLLLSQIIDI